MYMKRAQILAFVVFASSTLSAAVETTALLTPPMDDHSKFVDFMVKNRGEDKKFLEQRWNRVQQMVGNKDIWDNDVKRAFLMTPREEFVLKQNLARSYEPKFLDIGYGVTISGPNVVGRMTSSLQIKRGEKVLEIGTGSGYQSAILSQLTDKVYSVEIIKPLSDRTRGIYDKLIDRGYVEHKGIKTKSGDGYYGWEEFAPYDKIIVTCGIDHVPPPLLQQLKPNGIMLIPVGPPGAQRVLKIVKNKEADGSTQIARSDIYNGRIVPFVPFTKLENDTIKGTHNN
jgi:protein-L-isoaspartate(D-aspartate) O-methyltransferase